MGERVLLKKKIAMSQLQYFTYLSVQIFKSFSGDIILHNRGSLIPKLFLRLLWLFWRSASLCRQNRGFPQLFRFCSDLEDPGIWQIVGNSTLTGRWWEGRILINLCGKNNFRNCDLLQSDFFARCRTVLGRQRDFLACVVTLGKRWDPETLRFFTLEKHATKSHLQALVLGLVRSDISGHEKVA